MITFCDFMSVSLLVLGLGGFRAFMGWVFCLWRLFYVCFRNWVAAKWAFLSGF